MHISYRSCSMYLLSYNFLHRHSLFAPLAWMLTAMRFRDSHFAAILFFLCTITFSAAASPGRPLNIIQASADDNTTSSFNLTLPHTLKYAPSTLCFHHKYSTHIAAALSPLIQLNSVSQAQPSPFVTPTTVANFLAPMYSPACCKLRRT